MKRRWKIAIGGAGILGIAAVATVGLDWLDRAFPPPLPERLTISTEVMDRDGELLRAYATPDGYWRLNTRIEDVDPKFVKMLIAYEDKRFYDHGGIDLRALLRAAVQLAGNGRIVSGGSTLSMQLARLIEPRESRSFGSKFRQLARAVQIERRLSKDQILERYLTLAPYGGNLEGVRSASLAYFGKEPHRLTTSEAALLVALPQLPERRRPDRAASTARAARDRVLMRMVEADVLTADEANRGTRESISTIRHPLPALAAHFADLALKKAPTEARHKLTLKKSVQSGLEAAARDAASRLGPKVSAAIVLADSRNGNILGEVGSVDYFDGRRQGWIDMTRAVRSPGSTLKPFIYGIAFEQGLIAQETIIEDRPVDFAGYRPRNFDMSYQGDVSIRQALQMSLNVPAVSLLDAIGPTRLTTRIRQAGVNLQLPKNEAPGLAIGLGGAGISLRDLVQLYTGLANGGRGVALRDGTELTEPAQPSGALLTEQAAWQIGDILGGVVPPQGAPRRGLAYKTGTSYGYRDAWSVGYDGRYVLGVWVGRADGGSVPGLAGYASAAPILFDAFVKSGVVSVPLPRAPAGAFRTARADLPVTQKRFSSASDPLPVLKAATEPAPRIVFPPDGAHVELSGLRASASPLVLKLQGGRAPFRWLANGKPVAEPERRRTATWQPDGTGYSTLTVIDAAGRAASVKVFVE
ncbi:penicillin-binding protein 1C [Ochrobactrum daejeonense]|uniref:peptidoglycan glycosyltransferase n=1 Tax=Brucella daejeonensis TaxID=659015 RepID=A0A7W9ELX0_9HYPH|nr:penicillin-binding protein 1C [Brucella daejeonensis]MBB5702794.1 penicillin-binding protein 1C [Brucella daejeonensis]